MAYVRLDDSVMDNPKMLALSDRAFRGWVWGLCYAQRHLTDGFLPLGALTTAVKRGTPELMKRGLWEVADGGFQIHDYLVYQDSKAVVEARKANARDRMKDRRATPRSSPERAPDVRANIPETSRERSFYSLSVTGSGIQEEGSGEKPGWAAEDFMETFRDGWKTLYSHECSLIISALQVSHLTQQMRKIPEAQLRLALAAYFATDDPYVVKAKHPLPLFLREPLRFLATAKASASSDDKACPRCGTVPRCRSFTECRDRAIVAARPSAS